MRPIVHFIDPDRAVPYGLPGDREDPSTADVLRVARGLATHAECHVFQTLRTTSGTAAEGLHVHGMTHLLRDAVAEPDAVVLVDAYDLLRFVRRMSPDTRLVLWMLDPPGERWPGVRRIRERFGADVVARTEEVAAALALEGDAPGTARVIEAVDQPAEIDAWRQVLELTAG